MIAVTSSNSWVGCMATMTNLGAYTNNKVASGTSYWFKAYRDCNSNKVRDYGEPWGIYSNVSLLVTNNRTGINIALTEDNDEDDDGLPDWWELQYFGNIWTQNGTDDNDGDGLSNSTELSLGTNPANPDTDNDRLTDYDEIYIYGTSPTNSDTDCDNMGDGTEVDNGMSPTNANVYASLPFFESFDVLQYTNLCAANCTNFGSSVAIWSNTLLVGSPGTVDAANGRITFFEWDGSNWLCATNILAPSGATNFGISVALDGDRALVGADQAFGTGRAYVFKKQQGIWTSEAVLSNSDGNAGAEFGHALAINGSNIVVGAWKQSNYGGAYFYSFNGSVWTQTWSTSESSGPYYFSGFGCSVAVDGNRALIGALGNVWVPVPGRVYYYERQQNGIWQRNQTIYASDSSSWYGYGNALCISSNTLIVGSSCHDSSADYPNDNYGTAYVYTFSGNNWTNEQMLEAKDKANGNQFGVSVAMANGRILIGSHGSDCRGADSGCAYIFENKDSSWKQTGQIIPSSTGAGTTFGYSVSACGDRCAIGARGTQWPLSTGSTYVLSPSNAVASGNFEEGALLSDKDGWCVYPSELASLQSGVRRDGSGSLELSETYGVTKGYRLFAAHGATSIWVDCWAKLNPTNCALLVEHPDINSYPAWQASVYAVNGTGHLLAYDGDSGGTWKTATNFAVSATCFHRYTAEQNYVDKTWQLYLDGTNVFGVMGFNNKNIVEFSRFSFRGQWRSLSYLDSLSISTNQPSF